MWDQHCTRLHPAAPCSTGVLRHSLPATGKQLAADAADLLRNTSAASSQSVQATAKVLDTLTNQFSALEQLHAALAQINAAIQTNSASAEESAAASQQLHAQSSALEQHVSVFTLH